LSPTPAIFITIITAIPTTIKGAVAAGVVVAAGDDEGELSVTLQGVESRDDFGLQVCICMCMYVYTYVYVLTLFVYVHVYVMFIY
jgi:hypothetical protein